MNLVVDSVDLGGEPAAGAGTEGCGSVAKGVGVELAQARNIQRAAEQYVLLRASPDGPVAAVKGAVLIPDQEHCLAGGAPAVEIEIIHGRESQEAVGLGKRLFGGAVSYEIIEINQGTDDPVEVGVRSVVDEADGVDEAGNVGIFCVRFGSEDGGIGGGIGTEIVEAEAEPDGVVIEIAGVVTELSLQEPGIEVLDDEVDAHVLPIDI